jgi:DNA-binding HxlR family transcriptional regulator
VTQRSYKQVCGLAQGLDLIGERWTLLIIRELLFGPKRFGALRDSLPGINANLLSSRLRSLTEAGIVESISLPAPADGVSAYALTERGEGLREPIAGLSLWGMELLDPERQLADGHVARPSLYAGTRMAGAQRAGALEGLPPLVLDCEVDGEQFVIESDGAGGGSVRHGVATHADAALRCGLSRWYSILSQREPLDAGTPGEASALPAAALLDALAEEPALDTTR